MDTFTDIMLFISDTFQWPTAHLNFIVICFILRPFLIDVCTSLLCRVTIVLLHKHKGYCNITFCCSHTNNSFVALQWRFAYCYCDTFVLSVTEGIAVKAAWNAIQVKRKLVFVKTNLITTTWAVNWQLRSRNRAVL